MNRRIAFSTVLMIFAGYACNSYNPQQANDDCECKSKSIEKSSAIDQVKGNWKWIETSYFSDNYGSLIKTPNNTGKTMTYTFRGDTLIISSAGEILEKTRYEIGKLQDITNFPQDSTLIIRLIDTDNHNKISLLHFCGDSIILVNSYNNLGGNVKLRKEG
jgi:hypothetical protein